MIEDRVRDIESYFRVKFRGIAKPLFLTKSEWELVQQDNLHTPYGITVPELRDGKFSILICPEMIALQTIPLFDADLREYLAAWEMHLDMHVVLCMKFVSQEEIERNVDLFLLEEDPQLLSLLTKVQMEVLDG